MLVFTLLASAALIALSVGHAAAEGTEEVKQTVGASIRVEIDGDNQDNFGSPTPVSYTHLAKFLFEHFFLWCGLDIILENNTAP